MFGASLDIYISGAVAAGGVGGALITGADLGKVPLPVAGVIGGVYVGGKVMSDPNSIVLIGSGVAGGVALPYLINGAVSNAEIVISVTAMGGGVAAVYYFIGRVMSGLSNLSSVG